MPKGRSLSLKEKIEMIEYANREKCSVRKLASDFKVSKSLAAEVLKQKDTLMRMWIEDYNGNTKKSFLSEGKKIDSILFEWFCRVKSKSIPISGPILQETALEIARELGLVNFKASNGWLEKFRIRHNISFKSNSGHHQEVRAQEVPNWVENLPDLLRNYEPTNIFNAGETSLLFRALPCKSTIPKTEKDANNKVSKERVTVLLCANMEGRFEQTLVVGKAENPRCFKGINKENLPVIWRSNKKGCMTASIMAEWLEKFDLKMQDERREVVLFLDNAVCHPTDLKLNNINVIFLPTSTTRTLPMDQGMIENFKCFYRQLLLTNVASKIRPELNAEEVGKYISVLDAVIWVDAAVKKITPFTVQNCFLKAGFQKGELKDAPTELGSESHLRNLMRNSEDSGNSECYPSVHEHLQGNNEAADSAAHSMMNLAEESNGAEDNSEEDMSDEQTWNNPVTSYEEALKNLEDIKLFCILRGNAAALDLISQLEVNFQQELIQQEN